LKGGADNGRDFGEESGDDKGEVQTGKQIVAGGGHWEQEVGVGAFAFEVEQFSLFGVRFRGEGGGGSGKGRGLLHWLGLIGREEKGSKEGDLFGGDESCCWSE
jgi:hypothetical protein